MENEEFLENVCSLACVVAVQLGKQRVVVRSAVLLYSALLWCVVGGQAGCINPDTCSSDRGRGKVSGLPGLALLVAERRHMPFWCEVG